MTTPAPLDQFVVAVTGASSGIGEATAHEFARRGAAVVLGARRTERTERIADAIRREGGRAVAHPTDVTRAEDVVGLVTRAVEEFGRLDVFVGNAGVASLGPVADGDLAGWSAMVDVNFRGVLHGIAAAMPVFTAQRRGHFITTVSTSGLKIVPTQAVYAGTKNAVRTVLEALRQESTEGWLRTTSISPGYVKTELTGASNGPDAFGLDPFAVARAIVFAAEQPADVEIGDLTIRPTSQG